MSARFAFPLLGMLLTAPMLPSCGNKDDGGDGDAVSTGVTYYDPCSDRGSGLSCGSDCTRTSDCADGMFCGNGGQCDAECTPTRGCMGTCRADGSCDGQLEATVTGPGNQLDGPIIGADDPGSSGSGGSDAFDGCATSRDIGELTNVNMFVMFDNSLSMGMDNKWNSATAAMNAFFQDPQTGGFNIALRFFGDDPVPGCDGEACGNNTIDACAVPQVDLGEVTSAAGDAQESALVSAVNNQNPDFGGTPMFAALSGATSWAVDYQARNPDEQTVVLFVTDGVPQYEDCTEDSAEIAALASSALGSGVLTYAIGLEGSNMSQMDLIAQAGGTRSGIFIGAGQNAQQDLLDALNAIRGEVASCDVVVPAPAGDVNVDPDALNVTLTIGTEQFVLGQVSGPGECEDNGAWYYDPADPNRVLLCPAPCDAVNTEIGARIEVVLGCSAITVVAPLTR